MSETTMMFAFLLAFVAAFAATPGAKWLAGKINAIDVPKDGRRMHKKPIPRIGGLAIVVGFYAAVAIFCPIDKEIMGILVGALILVALGMVDDTMALSAYLKFPLQIVAAVIPVLCGVNIAQLTLPNGGFIPLGVFSPVVTVLWIVAITNAVNLIDGLDGLAVGVSSIASLALLVIAILRGDYVVAVLMAALVGSCFGFFPYNFNPASIFMGDTGATFLGYILAAISVQGVFKAYTVVSVIIPVLILGLPIFDTCSAIIRRLIHHKPIMAPDKSHLHHKLIDMGLSQRQAILVIYSICILLGLSAIVISASSPLKWMVFLIAIVAALVITMGTFKRVWNKQAQSSSQEDEDKK